jgi:hypothetical protein
MKIRCVGHGNGSVVFAPCVGHGSVVSASCVGHDSVVSAPYVGHDSVVSGFRPLRTSQTRSPESEFLIGEMRPNLKYAPYL